jgi:hypothetical protein
MLKHLGLLATAVLACTPNKPTTTNTSTSSNANIDGTFIGTHYVSSTKVQEQMDRDDLTQLSQMKMPSVGQQVAMLKTAHAEGRTPSSFTKMGDQLSKKITAATLDRSATRATEKIFVQSGGACGSLEFPGMGPGKNDFSGEELSLARDFFEKSKKTLQTWVRQNNSLTPETAAWMKERVRKLAFMTKTMDEEPDLGWRGIGVLSYDRHGNGVVQLGGGFAELVRKDPERARFEITRLVAQAWAPCQFQASPKKVQHPWANYLQCLKIDESKGCAAPEYTEAGWAVSSALAYQLSKPGCDLPAFTDTTNAQCAAGLVARK